MLRKGVKLLIKKMVDYKKALVAILENTLENVNAENTNITEDITNSSATNIPKLITDLQMAQTVYNLSLSVGSKIIPPSLADYL